MWLRERHMCFEEATYHPWSDLLQHRPEGSLEFSSDSPEAHKRGQEDWEHDQSESGVSLAESASPTTFLAGLKHTNFADKDWSSKAGCFDELGEVSSAQFTCQPQKEGYLEDRNDFYRKQLSYWRWEPLWLEQQNWNCQKLWIGRDWHYKSRKSFITSRGMSNPCSQSVRSLLSEGPISPHIPHTHFSNGDCHQNNARNHSYQTALLSLRKNPQPLSQLVIVKIFSNLWIYKSVIVYTEWGRQD